MSKKRKDDEKCVRSRGRDGVKCYYVHSRQTAAIACCMRRRVRVCFCWSRTVFVLFPFNNLYLERETPCVQLLLLNSTPTL